MKKSDKSIVLMLVGVVLAAASYFLVYQNLTTKTEEMNAANAALQTEVDYLQDLADNKQQYIDDTNAMQAKIEEIKAQFPAQYLPEDEILYMIATENTHDALTRSINMGMSTVIEVAAPAQEAPVSADGTEAAPVDSAADPAAQPATPAVMLYKTPVTASVSASYNSIKDIIKQINTDADRKAIDTISMAFDSETGNIASTIAFNMYSLTGTEAVYEAPSVSGITYGTRDIFNSAEKKAEVDAAKAAGAAQ